ncbi:hypothetical protein [Arenimonas composti]|uniref:hypothetical protein n=1 Tax=Arenimonas composti TaxID=370776 RepID=UPI00041FFCF0|nr:hypothetical protein [Arenimonas composti]
MTNRWVFEKQTRDGGAAGEAVRNAVEGGGWTSAEELLVREAIQNSVDAGVDENRPVRVRFRVDHFTGREKTDFLSRLSLGEFVDRHRSGSLKFSPGSVIDGYDDSTRRLDLLYIEDWNTCGLGGGLTDRLNGHFFRLLFLIGEGSKGAKNDGSGGSYGFGKGVYSYSSNIGMIFVFSVFEETEETNGQWARLLGCAYLQSHTHDRVEHTGRAWFGRPSQGSDGQSPFPITNEEACRLAAQLGFSNREREDRGTSVLVVGCDSSEGELSLEKIRKAAETWWWPRLSDDKLVVELVDRSGTQTRPDPMNRLDLRPYIQVRRCIQGHDRREEVALKEFNRLKTLEVGLIGASPITPDHESFEDLSTASESGEGSHGKTPGHRTVALIRRPGMVVAYQSWGGSPTTSAVGVFQAHSDIDRHLKLSEPVEHDRWDPRSHRLASITDGNVVVEKTLKRCKDFFRNYLRGLQPPPPPPKSGLDWLGRLLGQILSPRERGQPEGPGGERGRISIQTILDPRLVAGSKPGLVRLEAKYSLGLKPGEEGRPVVRIAPRLHVLEGDSSQRGELLDVTIAHAHQVREGDKPELEVEMAPDVRYEIEIESGDYSSDWAVSLHLEADIVVKEDAADA